MGGGGPVTDRRLTLGTVTACVVATAFLRGAASQDGAIGPRFEITVPAAVHQGPITGRVYIMVAQTDREEPRLQIGRTGAPFFGRDIEGLAPGRAAVIDGSDLGTPLESLRDLPAGDYFVQAFVNVYTEFHRADGHVVWMHDDRWEGQRWVVSPGNLKTAVERVHLDPYARGESRTVRLSVTDVLPPIEVPPDTAWVKRFKFESPSLTKFWGRPVYLGATVLLPRDYAASSMSYPVNYIQGHFSLSAPNGFNGTSAFSQAWMGDRFPRMILVTFQHPNPYFDDSYAVNSVNVGPYGDAIMNELIPEMERRYRVIQEPYARVLSGGSTGGWEALALQIFHPDFFGGTFAACPDPVTFTDVEGINVYQDENAFFKQYDWRREPTVNSRELTGQIRVTSAERNRFELVSGTHGRSGEQLDIWSAVFGPLGDDGYFTPVFDKRTGAIDREVAAYWRDHYDLLEYLKRNWDRVGPLLAGKLHVATGTLDTYFLNNSTTELETWLRSTTDPPADATFAYGDRQPHCWAGPGTAADRVLEMAAYIAARMPAGADAGWLPTVGRN
jgi:hypothetical protein